MKLNFSKDEFVDLLHLHLCSNYSFTIEQLEKYKALLDWKEVSTNKVMDWNYELLKQFEHYLDWKVLEKNAKVNKAVTLGLLFPNKVKPPKCQCSFDYEICECDNRNWHTGDWERGFLIKDNFSSVGSSQKDLIIQNIVNSIDELMLENFLLRNYIDNSLLNETGVNLID